MHSLIKQLEAWAMLYDSRRPLPSIQQSSSYKHPFALEHETFMPWLYDHVQSIFRRFGEANNENLIEREKLLKASDGVKRKFENFQLATVQERSRREHYSQTHTQLEHQ